MSDELWRKGALELAGMIANKEVSSREVVQAHLSRIDEVNPWLNAVVRRLDDTALAAADEADKAVAAGGPLGTFHGVPVTVKENLDLAGTPTTQSLTILADAIAPIDGPLVERVRAAGAIPIGRTNLPDLGMRVTTESSLHGNTHNPWHPTRTTGGSSGGEGAALASGMSPLGFGNDIGGSLRNPANCCGVASIKPTTGVVPWAAVVPPEHYMLSQYFMLTDGPMARNIADVRAGLLVIAGPHERDPRAVPVALSDHTAGHAAGRRVKVAVCAAPPGGATHPGIAAAISGAADALANAGAEVVEAVPLSFERAVELWVMLMSAELTAQRSMLEMVMGADAMTFITNGEELFPIPTLNEFMAGMMDRDRVDREWHTFFGDHDVLLLPTWTQPAFELGADVATLEGTRSTIEMLRPVTPANLLGLPAAVVPVGMADGLPVGAQVVGRRFSDLTCLAVAETLERAFGQITPIDPKR